MSTNFKYHYIHIPSGKSGINSQDFLGITDFLIKLNQWNRQGKGNFVYFSVNHIGCTHRHNPIEVIPDTDEQR